MSHHQFCHRSPPRLPRAGIDPIDAADTALRIVHHACSRPPVPETVLVMLDAARTGSCIVVIGGTDEPDQVLDVVEFVAGAVAHQGVAALVVGSVRPRSGSLPDDVDRWLEMSQAASDHGIDLLEWFVIGNEVSCPRDLLGEVPRWRR